MFYRVGKGDRMILRKPYAFFIKYFRLINLIIALLMGVSIASNASLFKFFTDYISDYRVATNNFVMSNYFNLFTYLIPVLIIIGCGIILSVLIVKDKPKKLYIANVVIYAALLILVIVDRAVLSTINEYALDIRASKALRDVSLIALILQVIDFFLTLVRAVGFDIKQFEFGKDLEQMNINVKDNEEFEVNVDIDKNKIKRNINKFLRNAKYYYFEHRLVCNIIIAVIILFIPLILFVRHTMLNDYYNEAQSFSVNNLSLNVKKSYIVSDDKSHDIVIVKMDVKKNIMNDLTLNTGFLSLIIQNQFYSIYMDSYPELTDIGEGYINQKLDDEYVSYIFSFLVPKSKVNMPMMLKVNDNLSYVNNRVGLKNVYVRLKPTDLTKVNKEKDYNKGDTIDFNGSVLGNSSFKIDDFEIANKFRSNYKFCLTADNCVDSYEYVTPTISGNYFKTLIKINGSYIPDSSLNIGVTDFNDFLNDYGTIYYVVNNKLYYHPLNSRRISPRIKTNDTSLYIEANKNIENASQIYIMFNIRNYTYRYNLK